MGILLPKCQTWILRDLPLWVDLDPWIQLMVGILTGQPMSTCEQPGLVLSLSVGEHGVGKHRGRCGCRGDGEGEGGGRGGRRRGGEGRGGEKGEGRRGRRGEGGGGWV